MIKRFEFVLFVLFGLLPLAAVIYFFACRPDRKAEATKLDLTYAADTSYASRERLATDSLWLFNLPAAEALPRARARIQVERKATDRVIRTGEQRIQNLQHQLKPTRLGLFVGANYSLPVTEQRLLHGMGSIRAGLRIGLGQGTVLEGYYDRPLFGDATARATWNIGIAKSLRLF